MSLVVLSLLVPARSMGRLCGWALVKVVGERFRECSKAGKDVHTERTISCVAETRFDSERF